jgi:cyanate permease
LYRYDAALAALLRRFPIMAYAYLSPCLAPLERAVTRSRLVVGLYKLNRDDP